MVSTYRVVNTYAQQAPGSVTAANVLALKPAYRWAVHQLMRAQDRINGHGARVFAAANMAGAKQFLIPSTDPDTGTRTYPDKGTERVVHRTPDAPVSAGYWLRVHVIARPSGSTQEEITPATDYDPDDARGSVKFAITWKNGTDTETRTTEIQIPPSQETYAGESTNQSAGFFDLVLPAPVINRPLAVWQSLADLANWTGPGVTASVVVSEVDSPRVAAWWIEEFPASGAKAWADTDWPFHGYSDLGALLANYPLDYPLDQSTVIVDPALGSVHMLDVGQQQERQLGPTLFTWSSYDPGSATLAGIISYDGTGDDEAEPVTGTNSTFEHLVRGSEVTDYDVDAPGWAVGSGAYGARYAQSATEHVLRGVERTIPVKVSAYMRSTSGGLVTLRIMTAAYSYVDLGTSSTSWGWVEAIAHLRCGRGPQDAGVAVPLVKVASGGWEIRYVEARAVERTA